MTGMSWTRPSLVLFLAALLALALIFLHQTPVVVK